jgi:phosphate/phosphite/phosphonate ABC transporter binding protein
MRAQWFPGLLLVALTFACTKSSSRLPLVGESGAPSPPVTEVRIGVQNVGDESTERAWLRLAGELEKAIHLPVRIRMAESYSELPTLLRKGLVDVALLPPVVYVREKQQNPGIRALATPVLSGSPTYLGHLYVALDAPFQSLADLKGRRIGYVSSASSSGYLFPRDAVRENGFDPSSFFSREIFFETHDQVLNAVASGEVDVGAAIDTSLDWVGLGRPPPGIRVIAKSRRIPHDCLAARPGFDERTALALRDALVSLHVSNAAHREILSQLHINGWVTTDEARYEVVREVLKREGREAPRD